jgi:hypothetical protein
VVSMSGIEKMLTITFLRPVPLALFALALFNLWIWTRRARNGQTTSAQSTSMGISPKLRVHCGESLTNLLLAEPSRHRLLKGRLAFGEPRRRLMRKSTIWRRHFEPTLIHFHNPLNDCSTPRRGGCVTTTSATRNGILRQSIENMTMGINESRGMRAMVIATRTPHTIPKALVALAFLATLSTLPVYHRHQDAKLLALAVPAGAILFAKRNVTGVMAVFLTGLVLALNADIPCAILTNLEKNHALSTATLSGKVMTILLTRPAALALVAMAGFYLWAYRRVHVDRPSAETDKVPDIDRLIQAAPGA